MTSLRYPRKVQQSGVLHHLLPIIAFVVLFGVIGTYFYFTTHAATNPPEILSSLTSDGNFCLNDPGNRTKKGSEVNTAVCNGSVAEHWTYTSGHRIENTALSKDECLGIKSNNPNNNAYVVVKSCNNSDWQKWVRVNGVDVFRNVEASTHHKKTGMCLVVYKDKMGSQLRTNSCNLSAHSQNWAATTYQKSTPPPPPPPPTPTTSVSWIVNSDALSLLEGAGASNSLIQQAFNDGQTYLTGNTPAATGIPNAVATAHYDSYADIQTAFTNGTLPGAYKAVIYDNEDYADGSTPADELQNPNYYEEEAANLVHAHGLTFIATPGADIVKGSGTLVNNNIYDTYLSRNIAGGAAKYADVIDIQAQGSETNESEFTSFVNQAVQQARQANPNIVILVGLSTNPDGKQITDQELYNDYTSVSSQANGYWLNVPGTSSQCPDCGTPQPLVGLYLLQKIY